MLCLVMHSAGGILVCLSCIMSRGDIRCTQEHDGDDPFGVPYIDKALCVLVNWRLIGGH